MLPALITPAIGFVSRHWKALAMGAVGLVVAIAFLVLLVQRNDARSDRDAALAQVASLTGHIERQNAAVAAMEAEGVRARQRSEQALQAAQAANDRQRGTIDSLRAGSQRVRGPNEACTISPELQGVEGL